MERGEERSSGLVEVIHTGECSSAPAHLSCGVPPGFMLEPMLFSLHALLPRSSF